MNLALVPTCKSTSTPTNSINSKQPINWPVPLSTLVSSSLLSHPLPPRDSQRASLVLFCICIGHTNLLEKRRVSYIYLLDSAQSQHQTWSTQAHQANQPPSSNRQMEMSETELVSLHIQSTGMLIAQKIPLSRWTRGRNRTLM